MNREVPNVNMIREAADAVWVLGNEEVEGHSILSV
jgi:hypothetical protein